jgi:hypothetical protein
LPFHVFANQLIGEPVEDIDLSTSVAATVTTAIATTSAATTTTAATATVSTTAAAAFFAWSSFINGQSTTINFLLVQATDSISSSILVCHFNKSKTFASTGITVLNDLSAAYCTELCEHFFQALAGNTVGQVTDVKFLTQNPKLPKKLNLTLLLGSPKKTGLVRNPGE